MPPMMRAYRITGWRQPPALVEVPVPVPGPGQVTVRVGACGLCHSDLAMMAMDDATGEALGWQVPFTLGHESAGRVAAVGPGVATVSVGDAVAVGSPSPCGACRWCRAGRDNACPNALVGRGYGRDGGLAEVVLVDDERSLFPIGELSPADAAPLTDAGATSYHAVRRVLPRVRGDGTVVVIGVGGLGGFVVQLLRALTTARVVALDPDAVRRDLAVEYGAHDVLDGVHDGSRSELRALVGTDGVDAVVDLVGIDATLALGTSVLAAGGVLALVGAGGGTLRRPWYGSLPRDGEVFTFQGSDRADAAAVIELARSGRLRVDTVPFTLGEVASAYAALRAGSLDGRVVVVPG